MTKREAAEFFHRYGNLGVSADDLLTTDPSPQQLDEACRVAARKGQPQSTIDEARNAILEAGLR